MRQFLQKRKRIDGYIAFNNGIHPLFSSLLLLMGLFLSHSLFATHNRAGEILVEQIGGCNSLTVRATIITWTKTTSLAADRDSLTICWGDGTCQLVARSNGAGLSLPDDIKYNTYTTTHTYAGPSRYRISMTDPNRIEGILNVNAPSSGNVPFHIETIYTFQDPQFGGCNSTPILLQPPVDVACVGKIFRHNPNAYDPDGDSLSYGLVVPLQSLNSPVPNYNFPYQINAGIDNVMTLNPSTGDLVWNSPQQFGEYNLAIVIVSWRDGVPIDSTIRDMQIFVDDCDNSPPDVVAPDELCVIAGDSIFFSVSASDPDTGDLIKLTARGGPFTVTSPAIFTAPTGFEPPVLQGIFGWQTTCDHISNTPYSVVFKAEDDFSTTGLADLKTTRIKVVGPPPLDVQGDASLGDVLISWEKPYLCENAEDNYFYGFSVWRREGTNPFPIDSCAPGLAGKGYTQIQFLTRDEDNGRYFYLDQTAERGRTYCYRILAKFARTSFGGYPYNLVESLPSEEVCVQLPRDLPLITQVDVEKTDATAGQILVRWTKPLALDLDTIVNPGPYRYVLERGTGFAPNNFTPLTGATWSAPQFWQLRDTVFTDTQNLDTESQPYMYRVAFYVNNETEPLGYSTPASSVFLDIVSTDNKNTLSWMTNVPWGNYETTIYRKNPNTGLFDSIGLSTTNTYMDIGLENGLEYCYKVQTAGTYGVDGIDVPLLNFSQEHCGIPLDTMPPCPPSLQVGNLCNSGNITPPDPPYENSLLWTNPNIQCPETDDVIFYTVYFSPSIGQTLELLATIEGNTNTNFFHELPTGIAGCYAVTATDSVGNQSAFSEIICVDNCPSYELPNTFTPNGDTQNDLFTPFPGWRFIESVTFQVFNRWGNKVFETTDPALLWDGNDSSGKALAEGTYFYICSVFEQRVEGVVQQDAPLKGYIELVRGR